MLYIPRPLDEIMEATELPKDGILKLAVENSIKISKY